MISLSAVIITFNEERNIARCLDSLQGIADEIIVLDSFSKDRTEEICRQKGARFFQHAFDGHIQQKNRAITHASHPYVLSLDADEALSPELKEAIMDVKKNWKADGYTMNRLTNYCGQWIRHCGWYPDTKLRLFDSRKGQWTGTNPHDRYEVKGATMHLSGDIHHYSYYTIEEHYKQANKFADIAAKAMKEQGRTISAPMVYLKAAFKFIRNYIIKLGFLDGSNGLIICRISAWETYLKYSRLRSLNQ